METWSVSTWLMPIKTQEFPVPDAGLRSKDPSPGMRGPDRKSEGAGLPANKLPWLRPEQVRILFHSREQPAQSEDPRAPVSPQHPALLK